MGISPAAPHPRSNNPPQTRDIPLSHISELFNVNQFIVSQGEHVLADAIWKSANSVPANPHIIPFINSPRYLKWVKSPYEFMRSILHSEIKHKIRQVRATQPVFSLPLLLWKHPC